MRRRSGENVAVTCCLRGFLKLPFCCLFQAFFQKQEPEGRGGPVEPRGPGCASCPWSDGEPGPLQ